VIEISNEEKTIGNEYTLKKYECGFCGYKFKQFVRSIMKNTPLGYDNQIAVSTQVMCKQCGAFLKTWDSGEVIDVYKGKPKKRQYEIDEKVKLK
jgi:hypothetical protein